MERFLKSCQAVIDFINGKPKRRKSLLQLKKESVKPNRKLRKKK